MQETFPSFTGSFTIQYYGLSDHNLLAIHSAITAVIDNFECNWLWKTKLKKKTAQELLSPANVIYLNLTGERDKLI